MTDDLVLYTNPMSRGRVARWMLEETGAPYRTVTLDYGDAMKAPGYLAISPMGKVPAIIHRGQVVTENAAICAYLADAFPEAGLAPPPAARAGYYRWLFFAAGPLDAAIVDRALARAIPSERAGVVGYSDYGAVLDAIEGAIAPGLVAGDRFTAADLYVASYLGFFMGFGVVERRPAFVDYVARMQARPAFARAEAIDGPMPPPRPEPA